MSFLCPIISASLKPKTAKILGSDVMTLNPTLSRLASRTSMATSTNYPDPGDAHEVDDKLDVSAFRAGFDDRSIQQWSQSGSAWCVSYRSHVTGLSQGNVLLSTAKKPASLLSFGEGFAHESSSRTTILIHEWLSLFLYIVSSIKSCPHGTMSMILVHGTVTQPCALRLAVGNCGEASDQTLKAAIAP